MAGINRIFGLHTWFETGLFTKSVRIWLRAILDTKRNFSYTIWYCAK